MVRKECLSAGRENADSFCQLDKGASVDKLACCGVLLLAYGSSVSTVHTLLKALAGGINF